MLDIEKISAIAKVMRDTRDESEGPRVPLKTILQNFLNHVENLEARVREGDDAYEKEFLVRRTLFFDVSEFKRGNLNEGMLAQKNSI